jgi:hypothetical protein
MFKIIWAKLDGKCTDCTNTVMEFFNGDNLTCNCEAFEHNTSGETTISLGRFRLPKNPYVDGEPFYKEWRLTSPSTSLDG